MTSPRDPYSPPAVEDSSTGPVWRMPGVGSLVLMSVAGFGGYFALLSVAPLWAAHGGADASGVGLVTGVLLVATILSQPFVPWALSRFGHGWVLLAGLVALGAPAPLYGLSDQLPLILAVSAFRGIGFAVITVTGSTVVAELVPQQRRGEAVGIYGLGIALPNLVLLPLSVAVADRFGFGWVFAVGAMPLLGIAPTWRLNRALTLMGVRERPRRARGVRSRTVLGKALVPTVVLFIVTAAGGGIMTFLPLAAASPTLSAIGLLVVGGSAALSRWWVGRLGDRYGPHRLMPPLALVTVAGLLLTTQSVEDPAWPWLLLPAMLLVGTGYGALHNLTLVSAFALAGSRHLGLASAVWNIGFDAGTATGAILLGVVANAVGFSVGFALVAALVASCLPVTLYLRRIAGP